MWQDEARTKEGGSGGAKDQNGIRFRAVPGRVKEISGFPHVAKQTVACEDLGCHILDIGQLEEFKKTIQKMDGCISLEYDYRHNIYRLFEYEDFEIRDISGDEPSAPPTIRIPPTMDVTREITWKEEIYKHVKRKGAIARGANKAFGLVW
eukprot:CAMPEP_0113525840 /NCGR_PEP_ID=MMETSP0015_2-20120614/402_1 /TAXON_ID=2838 /ORGANISM="Odontella" /LENGTH=149 /DNA_ID=CAMNT_0000424085 /DNA_START=64 /DNA_END=511 /DNA_ORIENTATION=+ /assembly_acc=CAM_ASM_000160